MDVTRRNKDRGEKKKREARKKSIQMGKVEIWFSGDKVRVLKLPFHKEHHYGLPPIN